MLAELNGPVPRISLKIDLVVSVIIKDLRIPESHFIPFEMYLSGFKYREIAERTGVSLGTIKSRIFHCRKKLKAILAE